MRGLHAVLSSLTGHSDQKPTLSCLQHLAWACHDLTQRRHSEPACRRQAKRGISLSFSFFFVRGHDSSREYRPSQQSVFAQGKQKRSCPNKNAAKLSKNPWDRCAFPTTPVATLPCLPAGQTPFQERISSSAHARHRKQFPARS